MAVVIRHVILKKPTTHAGGYAGDVIEVFDQKRDATERALVETLGILPCRAIGWGNNRVDFGIDRLRLVDRGVDKFSGGRLALFDEFGQRHGIVLFVVFH